MIAFILVSVGLLFLLFIFLAIGKRQEVMANWSRYRENPIYMATAFLFKPEDDPRSRWEFADDTFTEVSESMVVKALLTVLTPLYDIFYLMVSQSESQAKASNSMRTVFGSMAGNFGKIQRVFENRFKATLHALRMTFRRLFSAMDRTWATSVASLWQSISTINAVYSFIDLIIKIVIIILVILVAIIIFLFLFLWPLIPVILTVIGIVTAAGFGAAVGGMSDTFCFAGDTGIAMSDGAIKPISSVRAGDRLAGGHRVTAHMIFSPVAPITDMYTLWGIQVSGSHVVYEGGVAIHVRDHPAARLLEPHTEPVYCLNTTDHRIYVVDPTDPDRLYTFADWEELSDADEASLLRWNKAVHETLNPGTPWTAPTSDILHAEAVFHSATQVRQAQGNRIEIAHLRPGMHVMDAEGRQTRVTGVVVMHPSAVGAVHRYYGSGCWVRDFPRDAWHQKTATQATPALEDDDAPWYSIFTESGTFLLDSGAAVRDFSDIGAGALPTTYAWVLEALSGAGGGL